MIFTNESDAQVRHRLLVLEPVIHVFDVVGSTRCRWPSSAADLHIVPRSFPQKTHGRPIGQSADERHVGFRHRCRRIGAARCALFGSRPARFVAASGRTIPAAPRSDDPARFRTCDRLAAARRPGCGGRLRGSAPPCAGHGLPGSGPTPQFTARGGKTSRTSGRNPRQGRR